MNRSKLEEFYNRHRAMNTAMAYHLPYLRDLAKDLEVVEFGVMRASSSSAFLLGAKKVTSYDLVTHREALLLKEIAGDQWNYHLTNTLTADVPACDLILLDSLHTFAQVREELLLHASKARKYLVFHDSITFGSIGADGETGDHAWHYKPGNPVPIEFLGIRPAIDQFMIGNPRWGIVRHDPNSHGLLTLERR